MNSQFAEWRSRLPKIHPDHMRIARGAARISIFVLLGRCAGAFKEVAVAYRFGTGGIVDAYQLTLALVSWMPAAAMTIFGIVLIPVFVELRQQPLQAQAVFLGELEAWVIAVGVGFSVLLFLCWPFAIHVLAGNLSPETIDLCRDMFTYMAPIGILMLASGTYGARMQSRERHINTLLEGLPAVFVLCFVLLSHKQVGTIALIWGSVGGYLAQTLIGRWLLSRLDPIPIKLRLKTTAPEWRRVLVSARVLAVGQLIMCCTPLFDQFMAVQFGDGAVAKLGYANRVLSLFLSMGALAIGQATLPVFSDIVHSGDPCHARRTAVRWTILMFLCGTCVALGAAVFAPDLIGLAFQRGAFTAEDTVAVAQLFRWGQIQVPFYFSSLVLLTLSAGAGRYRQMSTIALAGVAAKVSGTIMFSHWFGIAGILLGTALMHATTLIIYARYAYTWSLSAQRKS
ncbi:hypothetical protein PPGU19_028130 [Paraburkholderia sp. PGU19]|uniref:murein biosynthesis integral membrane protein MurJ n=1 Tax=Paraburkholderia sp. PGU19 TaxID=2735434 RepID=UPI0015DA3418|nr:lipid II flippase MurJ [Paraburkholderia sp. PGU19]BCF98244.1 hypothetical protein PPGU19_028130 [Paraburkholderia sp. PGU19]